jgi:hypothetical protein
MAQKQLKHETYHGYRIEFGRKNFGKFGNIYAKVPSITNQILGIGKNKKEAYDQVKEVLDRIQKSHESKLFRERR